MFNFLNDYTRNAPKSQGIYDQNGIYQSMELRRDCYFPIYNDSWFIGRNAANSADINIFKVDSSDRFNLNPEIMTDMWLGSSTNLFLGIGVAGAGNLSHGSGWEGWQNTFIGASSGYSITSGTANSLFGFESGKAINSGAYNTCLGYQSGLKITTGGFNIMIGPQAGYNITSASSVVAIGYRALWMVTTTGNSVAIGGYTAYETESGSNMVCIGYGAGKYGPASYNNVYIGTGAGTGITGNSNNGNVGIGISALRTITIGIVNMAIGYQTLYSLTSGSYNSAISPLALYNTTTGYGSTAIGYQAGYSQVAVDYGIYIGYQAGYYETVGSKLYITNQKGSDEATGRVMALLYGVMSATTADQTLQINGKLILGNTLDINNQDVQFPSVTINDVLDEDDMASDSDTALATQQSIKKYVDDNAGGGGGFTTGFTATCSADTTLSTGTPGKIGFDTVGKDANSEWDAVNERWECQDAGGYLCMAKIRFDSNATGYRQIFIYLNGVSVQGFLLMANTGDITHVPIQFVLDDLVATDYVEIYGKQTSGGDLNVDLTETSTSWQMMRVY
jgi:hypothetical protein